MVPNSKTPQTKKSLGIYRFEFLALEVAVEREWRLTVELRGRYLVNEKEVLFLDLVTIESTYPHEKSISIHSLSSRSFWQISS